MGALAASVMHADEAGREEYVAQELYAHLGNIVSMHLQRVAFLALSNSAPSQTLDAEMKSLKSKMHAEAEAVDKLGFTDSAQKEKWKNVLLVAKNLDDTFTLARLYYSKNNRVAATFEFAKVQNYLDELVEGGQQLQDAQMQRINDRRQEREKRSQEIQIALWTAILGSLLTAFGLLFYFLRGTADRFKTLIATSKQLAAGQAPSRPMKGDDELAEIDKALQQLYAALSGLRQKERAILDNLEEVVCSIDEDLRLSDINNAAQKMWGYKVSDLLGKRIIDFMPKDDQKTAAKALRDAMQAGSGAGQARLRLRIIRANSTVADTEWSAGYVAGSRTLCCVVHDIEGRDNNDSINKDFEPTKIAPQLQPILPVVQAAVDSLSVQAQNKQLTVAVYIDGKMQAYFDRAGLTRIIVNLLSNAYKISPPSSQVRLIAVPTEGEDRGFVRLAVIDQGPGVPMAMQDQIFYRQRPSLQSAQSKRRRDGAFYL